MVLAGRVALCAGLGGPQLTRTMLLTWSQRAIRFVRKAKRMPKCLWNDSVKYPRPVRVDAEDGDYFNDVYKYDIATSMWGSVPSRTACMSCMCGHGV